MTFQAQLIIPYMGCYNDVAGDPALAHNEISIQAGALLSPSVCFLRCAKLGFLYSATQNGFDSCSYLEFFSLLYFIILIEQAAFVAIVIINMAT